MRLPPILQRLTDDAVAAERARDDAAATAAAAQLAAFDPSPATLTKARAATEKARASVDQLRAKLADAEHALAQAASAEAQLQYELGEQHRRLRRAAVAQWRVTAALEQLQAMADARCDERQSADGAIGMAGHRVLVDRLQTLRALAEGHHDPFDVAAFVAEVLVAVDAAESAARTAPRAIIAAAAPPRFGAPLIRR